MEMLHVVLSIEMQCSSFLWETHSVDSLVLNSYPLDLMKRKFEVMC